MLENELITTEMTGQDVMDAIKGASSTVERTQFRRGRVIGDGGQT